MSFWFYYFILLWKLCDVGCYEIKEFVECSDLFKVVCCRFEFEVVFDYYY